MAYVSLSIRLYVSCFIQFKCVQGLDVVAFDLIPIVNKVTKQVNESGCNRSSQCCGFSLSQLHLPLQQMQYLEVRPCPDDLPHPLPRHSLLNQMRNLASKRSTHLSV